MKRLLFAALLSTAVGARPDFSSADKAAVIEAAHRAAPPQAKITIERVEGSYARVKATLPKSDAATLFVKGRAGQWKVIAGPGTAWTPAELDRLGIPNRLR